MTDKHREALEQIALLDEADGHELTAEHAFKAIAIATSALGKHPSEIAADRTEVKREVPAKGAPELAQDGKRGGLVGTARGTP